MKNLFEEATVDEVVVRLDSLTPESRALWGKMNVAQMAAHCIPPMEMALGERKAKRSWIGRLIGPMFKGQWLSEKPINKNAPTDPTFLRTGEHDLNVERAQLEVLIRRFYAAGAAGCTTTPHSFFGPMTPEEWARLMYKHLDHHLQQFGA